MAGRKPAETPAPPADDLAEVVAVVARALCKTIVAANRGGQSATFRQIATTQASPPLTGYEVDVIERFLTAHPPGS